MSKVMSDGPVLTVPVVLSGRGAVVLVSLAGAR